MICIISPTYRQAEKFATTQGLDKNEWFYLDDTMTVLAKINFHVLVIGEFEEHKLAWFERAYSIAKSQGRKGRA